MIAFLLAALLMAVPALGQDDTCLMCHANEAAFSGREDAAQLVVDKGALAQTVHGKMGFGCTTCHADLTGDKVMGHAAGGEMAAQPAVCWTCHPQVIQAYKQSMHGYMVERGDEMAPTCATCHTPHDIRKIGDPDSTVHRGHVQETCESCHGQEGQLTADFIRLPDSTRSYTTSVHSVLTEDGLPRATCSDCHDAHALRAVVDEDVELPPGRTPEACGSCHTEIQAAYAESIHGRALAMGLRDSPGCTDCHGEHDIQSPANPNSPTSQGNQSIDTCGPCHEDPELIAKYGLQAGVLSSYRDSYHGWATALKGGDAATCVDCHTAHEVQPTEDPRSTVHEDNVVETCGECHPGSSATFAQSYDHISASLENNPINRWISTVYMALIVGTIGGMALHNILIYSWYVRQRLAARRGEVMVTRMTMAEVIQHNIFAIAFFGLVFTGFALRFPEAFWVEWLLAAGVTEELRALLHRVFAVIMVIVSIWHLGWLLSSKGRSAFTAMLPRFSDVLEAKDNLLYHLGLSDKKARFGRYDYTQKAEYWALIWGTGVMALTGFVLWFPTTFTSFLPWWSVGASQNVHYFEAWLAFLAIVVWHGFYVIVHPERYPIDLTFLKGKMPLHHAEHDHPRWEVEADPEPPDPKKK